MLIFVKGDEKNEMQWNRQQDNNTYIYIHSHTHTHTLSNLWIKMNFVAKLNDLSQI